MASNIIIVAAFWLWYFFILTAVYYIKEVKAWQPKPYGVLDTYPFICRRCLTTWTLVASYISIGIIISNPWFAYAGTLLGAATGYAMYYTEKERMGNNEDK